LGKGENMHAIKSLSPLEKGAVKSLFAVVSQTGGLNGQKLNQYRSPISETPPLKANPPYNHFHQTTILITPFAKGGKYACN